MLEYIDELSVEVKAELLDALDILEFQRLERAIAAAKFPHLSDSDKAELHKFVQRNAYPGKEEEARRARVEALKEECRMK